MHTEYKITIKANGRLVLPIKVREQLGITAGDQFLLIVDKDLKMISLKESIRRMQEKVKKHNAQGISLVRSLKKTRSDEMNNE